MKYYIGGHSLASSNTVYPLDIPLGMLRAAEQAAKEDKQTFGEFVRACIDRTLEDMRDIAFHQEQAKKDEATLKRLSRTKKITIIKQEN